MSFFVPRREQGAIVNVMQGLVLGIVLTALSYALGLGFGWISSLSWLEAFAVFTSYVCTFLCVVERRANYPIGAISNLAYCLLFVHYNLMASAGITGFLTIYLLYGWFRWKSDNDTRPITSMTRLNWIGYLGMAAVGYLAIVGIATLLGGHLVWTDSVIFAGTVLAQFMLDNKKFENWHVWAVMNGFAIYTYFAAGLTLVGFQYIFFFLNCFYAIWMWSKARREQRYLDEKFSNTLSDRQIAYLKTLEV